MPLAEPLGSQEPWLKNTETTCGIRQTDQPSIRHQA